MAQMVAGTRQNSMPVLLGRAVEPCSLDFEKFTIPDGSRLNMLLWSDFDADFESVVLLFFGQFTRTEL